MLTGTIFTCCVWNQYPNNAELANKKAMLRSNDQVDDPKTLLGWLIKERPGFVVDALTSKKMSSRVV